MRWLATGSLIPGVPNAVIVWAVVGAAMVFTLARTAFGRSVYAIGNRERAAYLSGVDTRRVVMIAFIISAALAGMAGVTKTLVFQLASLSDVHWHASGEVVLMTLLGGLGTILGPVVGAATIVSLQTQLADSVGSWVTVIMGAIFVVCVLSFRRGMVGELQALIKRSGVN